MIASSTVNVFCGASSFGASFISASIFSARSRASNSGMSVRMGWETIVFLMSMASSGVKYGALMYSSSVVHRVRASAS